MKRVLLASLLVALAALPAAAASPASLEVVATHVRADGATDASGRLAVLLQEFKAEAAWFELSGAEVRLEMDEADPTIENPVNPVRMTPGMTPTTFRDALVTGVELRSGHAWNLFPVPQRPLPVWTVAEPSCLTMEDSALDSLSREPLLNADRPDAQANLHGAAHVGSCAPELRLQVEGAFCLSLWEWDADVDARDGPFHVRTGRQRSQVLPEAPGVTRNAQAFLCSDDARLLVALRQDTFEMHAMGSLTTAATSVHVLDAHGILVAGSAAPEPVEGDILFTGDVSLVARSDPAGVSAQVRGDHGQVEVDGTAVVPPSRGLGLGLVAWLAVGLAAATAAVAGARFWSRRRGNVNSALANALEHSEKAQWRRAMAHASKALRLKPSSPEAHALRAYCLTQMGRHEEALADHEAAHRLGQSNDSQFLACNAIEATRTLRHLGREGEALDWLQRAFEADAGLAYRAMDKPELAGLRGSVRRHGVAGYS